MKKKLFKCFACIMLCALCTVFVASIIVGCNGEKDSQTSEWDGYTPNY